MSEPEPIDLQPGPQQLAAESEATIIVFGGGAGGGKTRWEVHEAAKWFDTPGYGACIYRRTYGELTAIGGVCEEMAKIYPHLGGVERQSKHEWRFPSGARVAWGQMEHEATSLKHLQGTQFSLIALDELTHFTEKQFWMAFSRLRTMAGVITRLLATCNPEPDSWVRRLIAWWIGPDGYPIAERAGVIRFFSRDARGALQWHDTAEECVAAGGQRYNSLTFIPSRIWDNKILMANDPGYLAKLQALPPVEQARFLGGNWDTRESSGDMFQRGWFPRLHAGPLARKLAQQPPDDQILHSARVWDLAGTPMHGDLAPGVLRPADFRARTSGDPDWTRSMRVDQFRDGRVAVRDMLSCRDTPGAVEDWMLRTAESDGPGVEVVVWQDPGQAAIFQMDVLKAKLARKSRRFTAVRAQLSKEDYAKIASRTAFAGKIFFAAGDTWQLIAFNELENFPGPGHDDIVDCLSLAIVHFLGHPRSIVGYERVGTYRNAPAGHFSNGDGNDVRTTARFASL